MALYAATVFARVAPDPGTTSPEAPSTVPPNAVRKAMRERAKRSTSRVGVGEQHATHHWGSTWQSRDTRPKIKDTRKSAPLVRREVEVVENRVTLTEEVDTQGESAEARAKDKPNRVVRGEM